ncbi:MAG TPA: AAA family ATPase [Solirubrobacteraceae bacterium]|nr:AAA family ATPase [Solirubrobacteraceae bacterium]
MGVDHGDRALASAMPGRQGRLLFAYLVLNRDRDCGRPELIDLLWPERPPAAADTALSALLSKLRKALGEGALAGRSELRFLPGGPIAVDLEVAATAAARAEAAIDAHDWGAAAARAREVISVDLQTFLPDCDGPWVAEVRRELETIRLRGLESLGEACLHQGGRELGAAEQAARAAIAAAPFRESAHRLLMEVHEAQGNPAEALRVFEELRILLRDELGTTPGQAAMTVHERVLRGETPTAKPPPTRRQGISVTSWPAPLAAALERHALVGRAHELDVLEACWTETINGARPLVLLAGDAGIGKTRLAAEIGQRAQDDGAHVLYGRFDEQALAPYQPVVEMVRGWSSGASLEPLRERVGVRAADLAILFGEFGPPRGDDGEPGPHGHDADARRMRFFDAVAALLGEIGAGAPLVLVFDDLHWADRPTLQLIRHLVRSPQPRRALLLGTYRDAELEPGHPLHELIGDVRREGMLRHVELTGLAEPEVAELVRALGVPSPEAAFVRALHGETEGNPFFIEEVVRHLRDSHHDLHTVSLTEAGVPEGVREVTARRLRRLGADSRQALQVAAVIGRDFDYDVLEAVAPLHDDALITALEEGVEARVLRETGRVGRYAFTHALVRATLYDSLSQLRRARLHGRVGEAIARLRSADLDPFLPQLAHHFAQAAPVEQPERAIDFALAAARRADRLLAWEEAAEHYRAALRARGLAGHHEDRVRAELLLALGASEDHAGMEEEARATFEAAAATSRALGDGPLLGRAALGFAGPWSILGRVDEERVAVLEEALTALGGEDSPLRARLLARLALELYYSGDPDRRLALSEDAVELARRLGDPRTLAICLDARHYALWRPENVNERLEVASELRRVAEQTGDPELELEGAGWTVVDLLELGDVQGADIQIAAASKLAEALQRPIWLWWSSLLRCTRAQLVGDFDEAERLADATIELGRHGQAENAANAYAQAMFNIRREQGRLSEVEPAVRRFIDIYPMLQAWRAALALLLVELGRLDEARTEFETLAADELPRDANWLIGVTLLAEVCGALGDGERAEGLYALLEPYAGRNVVVGRAATCNGAASRLLGILATAMREWERAEGHFISALAMHERMGAKPWVARTQLAYAEMLLARRQRGDKARARELLADAVLIADALGMGVVAQRARDLVPAGAAGPGGAIAASGPRS